MINKRSLWFLTLFSLILVLSVYYITMPSELLMASNEEDSETVSATLTDKNEESAEIVALRVEEEEKMLDEITELKKVLTDSKSTTEEKNKAFDRMQELNKNRGLEESLENKIKENFDLKAFVSIDESNVEVTVDSTKHDKSLANKIMRAVQEEFETSMNISVKFQK